jgi:hypothetical protein
MQAEACFLAGFGFLRAHDFPQRTDEMLKTERENHGTEHALL